MAIPTGLTVAIPIPTGPTVAIPTGLTVAVRTKAGWILSELGLRPGEKQGDAMKATGPYVPLSSEREIFARLGVAWCDPRD